ncbi:hypothetical protein M231_07222 [Tremella mesenterica]|uniref:Uncharacterized protein n=1 Tax=Tremella mesenterica TaxID=5217 RepID=A0A4Q1BFX9_TREME|nr:hypothetical protein M231_07222 [Tremella mesenterica]
MVTRRQAASLKKATAASVKKRRRSHGSRSPVARSTRPVAAAGPSTERIGQGPQDSPAPRHLTPFPREKTPIGGPSFPSTPLREVPPNVEYQTPNNRKIKGGVEASGPPYRDGPVVVVPKPGGRQNSYHDIVLQPIDVSSVKVQHFIKYLRSWKSTKAESTRAKVDPVLEVLGTEGTIVGYASQPCDCCEDMLAKPTRWQDFTKKWPCLVPVIRFLGSEQYHIGGHCYWCLVDQGTCSFAIDSRIGPRDQLKLSLSQWRTMYRTLDKAMANIILLDHRFGRDIDKTDENAVMVGQQVNDVYRSVGELCQKLNDCKISGPDNRLPVQTRFGTESHIQIPDHSHFNWNFAPMPDKKKRVAPIVKIGSSSKKSKKSKGKQKAVQNFESDTEPSDGEHEETEEDDDKSSSSTSDTDPVDYEAGDNIEEPDA